MYVRVGVLIAGCTQSDMQNTHIHTYIHAYIHTYKHKYKPTHRHVHMYMYKHTTNDHPTENYKTNKRYDYIMFIFKTTGYQIFFRK